MPIYVHTFKACEALCKNAYYNKIRLQLSYRTWVIDALQIPKRSVAMRSPVCERTASMLSGRAAITAAASSGMPSWFAVFICNTSSGTTHVAQRSTPRRSSMKPGLGPVPRGPTETHRRDAARLQEDSPLYTLNAGSCSLPPPHEAPRLIILPRTCTKKTRTSHADRESGEVEAAARRQN